MTSIATLINEDDNFCSVPKTTTEHEISSWSIEPSKTYKQKPLKNIYFASLPPIHKANTQIFIPDANSTSSLSALPSLSPVQKTSKNTFGKIEDKRERVRITELKSLESFTERIIDYTNKKQFQPFHPQKIRSSKKSVKNEIGSSINIGKNLFNKEVEKKSFRKQSKMVIGLVHPMKFYDKYFNGNNFIQGVKAKGRLSQFELSNLSRNEKFNEIVNKITSPTLRSQSMFTNNFTEKLSSRNKYLLKPILRDE